MTDGTPSLSVRSDPGTAERNPLSASDVPAAFWSEVPDDDANPDLLALNALQAESTPAERAETLKASRDKYLVD